MNMMFLDENLAHFKQRDYEIVWFSWEPYWFLEQKDPFVKWKKVAQNKKNVSCLISAGKF